MKQTPVSGPHISPPKAVSTIMNQVIIALLPALGMGMVLYGWPAIFLSLSTILAALGFEALSLQLKGARVKPALADGSALLTGLLVALSLPAWAPWWIGVVGAGLAIVLGKQVYGGLGQNLFNPAMLARVALLISFPIEMTCWVNVHPLFFGPSLIESVTITFAGQPLDGVVGATTLGAVKTGFSSNLSLNSLLLDYSGLAAFIGWERGSLGETSTLLLLLGGLRLLRQGIIQWFIPGSLLATISLLSLISHWLDPQHYLSLWVQLNSGALMLVAFFIATDYVTSPNTPKGQLVFGTGCGLLIFIIRTWGSYPEGTGFAILLMNAASPLIDHYLKPRIYGRYHNGKPLDINQG